MAKELDNNISLSGDEDDSSESSSETNDTESTRKFVGNSNTKNIGDIPVSYKEAELNKMLRGALSQFKNESIFLITQLFFWGLFSVVIVCLAFDKIDTELHCSPAFKNNFDVYYYLALRLTLVISLISIAAFLLKMFRNTLHMFQINRHRVNVIQSMPSFLAATDSKNEQQIYDMLLKIIVKPSKTGFISNEPDINSGMSTIKSLINEKTK